MMRLPSGPRKIVVIGPESTGKSTLSAGLAGAFGVPWVPEFARAYCEGLDRPYTADDLLRIAEGQIAGEARAAADADRLIICDTDLYVIKVWSEHSFGHCHRRILQEIAVRRYDGYLLTGIDMPWTPDPLREHGEARLRRYFYEQYRDIVINSGVPWAEINGSEEERLAAAKYFVDRRPPGPLKGVTG
jgi:NadR type nicotinamide-nucleotide adenylyltransferase